LDGSKLGEAALRYVEGLVSRLSPGAKVEVTLFHVITTLSHDVNTRGAGDMGTISIPYAESELEQMKDKAIDYLNKVGEGLRSEEAVVRCKSW